MRYGSLSLTTFVLLGNVTSINQKRNCSDDGDNDFIEWVWDNALISNNKRESETASILDLSASVIFSAIPLLPKVTMKSCHLPYISTKDITLDRSGIAQLIAGFVITRSQVWPLAGEFSSPEFLCWFLFMLLQWHVTDPVKSASGRLHRKTPTHLELTVLSKHCVETNLFLAACWGTLSHSYLSCWATVDWF